VVDDVEDALRRVVDGLEAAGVPYMLTGSFASGYYGQGRSTQDIDFVIMPSRSQLRALLDRLAMPHFYVAESTAAEALRDRGQFNAIDRQALAKVDFIIRKERSFSQTEFERRISAVVAGVPLMIASAEDVILSKLEWAKLGESDRQIIDVRGILQLRWDQLDKGYLARWIDALDLHEQWRLALRAAGLSA
jgi:hypothetical protein